VRESLRQFCLQRLEIINRLRSESYCVIVDPLQRALARAIRDRRTDVLEVDFYIEMILASWYAHADDPKEQERWEAWTVARMENHPFADTASVWEEDICGALAKLPVLIVGRSLDDESVALLYEATGALLHEMHAAVRETARAWLRYERAARIRRVRGMSCRTENKVVNLEEYRNTGMKIPGASKWRESCLLANGKEKIERSCSLLATAIREVESAYVREGL